MMTSTEPKKVILVVDDEADIRDTLTSLLDFLGYAPLVADDRDNALQLVKHQTPDAVILDWHMPGMTIEKFLSELRNMKEPPEIVLLTAGFKAADKARELGLQHYIPKPFDLDLLEQKLKECLTHPN